MLTDRELSRLRSYWSAELPKDRAVDRLEQIDREIARRGATFRALEPD